MHSAGNALCRQLLSEENYYTVVSIIEALGKLDCETGLAYIEEWLNKHEKDIIERKMYSVFRHVQNAVTRLDHSPDGHQRGAFIQKYANYITDNVPL